MMQVFPEVLAMIVFVMMNLRKHQRTFNSISYYDYFVHLTTHYPICTIKEVIPVSCKIVF